MTFEAFERPVAQPEGPLLTVYPSGRVLWNRAAHELLDSPPAVDLLRNRQLGSNLIGVRPTTHPETAYRVTMMRDGGPAAVEAKDFFDQYGIVVDQARSWPAALENGVLVVDLGVEGRAA